MSKNEIISEQIAEMKELAGDGQLRNIIESEIYSNLSQNYSDEINDLADSNGTTFEDESVNILDLVMQKHDEIN